MRLYPGPGIPPVERATVLIRDGTIAEVGADVEPGALTVLDGGGRAATAGLWNSHVHFIDPELAANAQKIVREMLLRYGFTSVLDTGSVPADVQKVIAAIESGDIDGPRIFTAAGGFVFTNGTPDYLPGTRLPELATPAAAPPAVEQFLDAGANGIKIFSGSFKSQAPAVLMPPEIIRAVTEAAHARNSFVVAHPQTRDGLVNAVANGVDVLAHTAPTAGPLGAELIDRMLERNVALIPTLKLWSWELRRFGAPEATWRAYQEAGVEQLAAYSTAGGEILFGTDVGYMRDYDTTEELELMGRAGMTFEDVLAALSTRPAARFAGETGFVEPGARGDLVIMADDPEADVTAFARIAFTIRGGRIVYRSP